MRRIVAAVVLAIGLAGPAPAQQPEIESVISRQMEAFLDDDVATAFGFASPAIKRLFGTPENFGAMVRRGYPMVWRPAEVTFLGLERSDGALVQNVMVRDGAGAVHVLAYEMIETAEGWQINGVRILPAIGASA